MYFSAAVLLSLSSVALARPVSYQRRAALDTGSCGSPEIEFANGLDGRNEPSFQAVNQQDFNHGSALNIGVIADFVCGQLQSKCQASAATVSACDQATQAAAQATGGAAADAFNAALGITSDFAAVAVGTSNNAARDAYIRATLDTGSCGSPEIEFANGLDGRNEPSFQAVNQADFNHGSALNIGVIANFICGQLSSKCQASAATITACDQATQAAAQATGGAAADAFNAALGITSDFATVVAARAAAGNLQTFTGSLGASSPAVTASGNEFQVDGNAAFQNLQNALVRSCDVQHNQCANAANASDNTGALSVDACATQQDQCNAAAQSSAAA